MGKQFTILHVDDERGPLYATRKAFERWAPYFRLIQTHSSMEATTYIKQADVLLTDIHMPELSGPRLARIARAINPNIPIIYNTASESEDDRKEFQLSLHTGYTTKIDKEDDPVKNLEQLVQFMHTVCNYTRTHPGTLNIGDERHGAFWTDTPHIEADESGKWLRAARILQNVRINSILREGKPTDEFSDVYPHINDPNAPHTRKNPQIYIITGPKGSGKDSLVRNAHLALPYTHIVRRHHTRGPRPLEFSGHPIQFVEDIPDDPHTYASTSDRGEGARAGISWDNIAYALREAKDALIVAGTPKIAADLRTALPEKYSVRPHIILIDAPFSDRKARTTLRGGSPEEDDTSDFEQISPDLTIENRGNHQCRPYLPSEDMLRDLHDSTKQLITYIQKS